VFTTIISIASGIDIENVLTRFIRTDIIIADNSHSQQTREISGMDRGFIDEVAALPGVTEVLETSLTVSYLVSMPDKSRYVDWLMDSSAHPRYFAGMTRAEVEANLPLGISGIDTQDLIRLNENLDTPVDIEAFERGEVALVDISHSLMWRLLYDFSIEEFFPKGSIVDVEMGNDRQYVAGAEIVAHVHFGVMTYAPVGDVVRIIMSNRWMEERLGTVEVIELGINVESGTEVSVLDALDEVILPGMFIVSVHNQREAMETMRFMMFVIGAGVSGILALIGLFNFVNVISVGLLTRKQELAAFESVGMSKKQMRSMLRWEGGFYSTLSILTSVTIGTGISYGLFALIHNQDPIQYPNFVYPLLPIGIMFGIIVFVCLVTPELAYRSINKSSLVERLREAE
jgi:putative ABC transport system permease protein